MVFKLILYNRQDVFKHVGKVQGTYDEAKEKGLSREEGTGQLQYLSYSRGWLKEKELLTSSTRRSTRLQSRWTGTDTMRRPLW